jgi:hypothetical protein
MPQGFDPTAGGTVVRRSGPLTVVPRTPQPAISSAGPQDTEDVASAFPAPPTAPDVPHAPGETETLIREALAALDAERSWRGAIALALARDIDSSATSGSQRGTLSNQLTKTMLDIESMAPLPPDELDELKDAIERQRAEAST